MDTRSFPRSRDLRKGRASCPHQAYLITLVTHKRIPCFTDLWSARLAIRQLHEPVVARQAVTLAFVVMPDHVHWLLQLEGAAALSDVIRIYKAKVSLGMGQRIWQKGFHDHAVRADEDLHAAARYIVANPVRAGLVASVAQYPHWDAIWL